MFWIQLELTTQPEHCNHLEQLLLSEGACSVTFLNGTHQSIYEASTGCHDYWDVTIVHGLFEQTLDTQSLTQTIQETGLTRWQLQSIKKVQDQCWETVWKHDFHPLCFSNRLWVYPSWCKPPTTGLLLKLDPGLGFGTGTHPTTATCIEWLIEQNLAGKTVIDYGCGSGILALSAILLGAEHVFGTDIDEQALAISRQNALNNQISTNQISFVSIDQLPMKPVDIVIANILSEPLKKLAPRLTQLVKNKGYLVLSGLLEDQIDSVITAYQMDFEFENPVYYDEWIRLTAIKRDPYESF